MWTKHLNTWIFNQTKNCPVLYERSLSISFACLFQILRHPTKPNVTPVEVLPVFPDFQVVFINLHEVIYQTQDTWLHHIFNKKVENVMGRVVLLVDCLCFVSCCQDEHFVECFKKSNPLCYTSIISNQSKVQVSVLNINLKTHTMYNCTKIIIEQTSPHTTVSSWKETEHTQCTVPPKSLASRSLRFESKVQSQEIQNV